MRDRKIREEKFRLQQEINRLEYEIKDMEDNNGSLILYEIMKTRLKEYKTDIKNVRFKQL